MTPAWYVRAHHSVDSATSVYMMNFKEALFESDCLKLLYLIPSLMRPKILKLISAHYSCYEKRTSQIVPFETIIKYL